MKEECCKINDIIQEFYDYLKAYIYSKTKDESASEDIIQNVMVKLVESYHNNTQINNIKAWLFQVSRNSIADYYKKQNLEFPSQFIKQSHRESLQSFPELFTSDYIIPMIRLLPEKYAIPLELSDIEKIPQRDIASKLNLSVSATKMRVQRGRIKLRELFVECCHLEYDKHDNLVGCTIKHDCKSLNKIKKDLNNKLQNNNNS